MDNEIIDICLLIFLPNYSIQKLFWINFIEKFKIKKN